jgi:hypothetical protein
MKPSRTLSVHVNGARDASSPATWGHQVIWRWRERVPDDTHFVTGAAYELPAGCTAAAVTDAIAHVFRRYDVLRTFFRSGHGRLRQLIRGSGEVEVGVYQAAAEDAGEAARAIARELSGIPFRSEEEWPVRVAIVESGHTPAFLVFVSDRMAFDGHGSETVVNDLLKACTGEAGDMQAPWQPVDQAAYEQSPEGIAVSERAIQYWRRIFEVSPASIFDFPLHQAGEMRFCHQQMTSPAITQAVRLIRKRSRLSASSLLLAAAAVVLRQYTGHPEIAMRMIAGNRSGRDRKAMVGTLASEGVFLLDVDGLSFGEITRAAFRASGAAHQFAYCDPAAVEATWARSRLARGAYLDLGACFSDIQGGFADPRAGQLDSGGEPDLDEPGLRRLAESGTLTASGTPAGIQGLRFFLVVMDMGDILLRLSCDTRFVPESSMREMLYGMERLLIAAACRDLSPAELAETSGITPVPRGPSWMMFGKDWVDMAAAQRLWERVTGSSHAALLPVEGPQGDQRLIGYVAADRPPVFTDLHRDFVAALGDRSDVRAPDLYRLVAAGSGHPGDAASWLTAPVLAEADGRIAT